MKYRSTKTYTHELGLSACFRQWRAKSHCRFFHGYALSFKFEFVATHLDDNNWVVDFGSLKDLRQKLEEKFDHRMVVAKDDPEYATIMELEKKGLVQTTTLDNVGCEAFAFEAFQLAKQVVFHLAPRAHVLSCECREHGANSAIFIGDYY